MHVLIVQPQGSVLPDGTASVLHDIGWPLKTVSDFRAGVEAARGGQIEAAIFPAPEFAPDDPHRADFDDFVEMVSTCRIAAVMVSDHPESAAPDSRVDVVDPRITAAELRGRLTVVERYHGLLRRVEDELHTLERLSIRLGDHFREVDEELRLAARLQRDFLPVLDAPYGRLRFSAIFRPASWVSGDIYDVFRIDDEHTGIYMADAVGHGMAASLLTMFIKRAILPTNERGEILPPSRVLAALNNALAAQALPQCQFVTACYAVFHQPTGVLTYARGGHPYPFLFSRNGAVRELDAAGGLLGITRGETFDDGQVTLAVGDKVTMYSDGVEVAIQAEKSAAAAVRSAFAEFAALPLPAMFSQLQDRLESGLRAVDPADDVTVLGFQVER